MDLSTLLDKEGISLVDVREPGEFRSGHIEGSVNLPLSGLTRQVDQYRALGRPLILVCRSGSRSGMATQFLRAQGLEEVYNGGAWDDVQYVLSRKVA